MSENKVYLEREAVINQTRDLYEYEYPTASGDFDEYVTRLLPNALLNMKPSDVKPVVRGEWVHRKVRHSLPWDCPPYYGEEYDRESHSCLEDEWHCSNCDYETDDIDREWWNFCPNCGADMIEEVNDER